jgi:hypothetical protein
MAKKIAKPSKTGKGKSLVTPKSAYTTSAKSGPDLQKNVK